MYTVTTQEMSGGAQLDYATTGDMGGLGRSADAQRELAESYAATMLAQETRRAAGAYPVRVYVRNPYGHIIWDRRSDA